MLGGDERRAWNPGQADAKAGPWRPLLQPAGGWGSGTAWSGGPRCPLLQPAAAWGLGLEHGLEWGHPFRARVSSRPAIGNLTAGKTDPEGSTIALLFLPKQG